MIFTKRGSHMTKIELPEIKKGDIVQIRFLDHVEDGDKPLDFIVWGRIDRVYKKSIRVVTWAHAKARNPAKFAECTEKTFTIVKSTVTELKVLH